MIPKAIEVENLGKSFVLERPLYKHLFTPFEAGQKVCALRRINFSIESGEILGVVGPNGAGKTTLLRILAGLLEPSIGSVKLCGRQLKAKSRRLRGSIGYVSGNERSFFWRLTGRENLEFFGRLYGLSGKETRERTLHILKQFGFEEKSDQLFRDYSTGMRKKIALMRVLLHQPCIMLLDEVTNSLDPKSAKMVKDLVREYISNGKYRAAVWSTHRLEEIAEICDQVIMIEEGNITFDGQLGDFRNKEPQKGDYLLKAKNINGQFEAFCRQFRRTMKVNAIRNGNVSKFVFSDISGEDFGHIITMAVKNYGAYVIFAGCFEKKNKLIFK